MNKGGINVENSTLRIGGSGGQPLNVFVRTVRQTYSTCEISSGTSTPHRGVSSIEERVCVYVFIFGIFNFVRNLSTSFTFETSTSREAHQDEGGG